MCPTVPGSWNTRKNVWVGDEQPSQACPPYPQKGSSRDPAAMEETFAKNTPYSFEAWHSWVQWPTEWENCIFMWTVITTFKWHCTHCICIMLICVYNCYNSFRRINLHGVHLYALILCLCTQNSLSNLEHSLLKKFSDIISLFKTAWNLAILGFAGYLVYTDTSRKGVSPVYTRY
jgi:hypothetical protein